MQKRLFEMSNEVYDVLKWITMLGLPATATLYVALAGIWGFPYADEVAKTTAAVVTFLAVVLKISNEQYKASNK